MRTMTATEFKAKCLAVLDDVARTGERVTILKRGKPVAQVGPALPDHHRDAQDALMGSVTILGDIISPAVDPDDWEANRQDPE